MNGTSLFRALRPIFNAVVIFSMLMTSVLWGASRASGQGAGDWQVVSTGIWGPFNMDFDAEGNLYVANEGAGRGGDRIIKITPDGTV